MHGAILKFHESFWDEKNGLFFFQRQWLSFSALYFDRGYIVKFVFIWEHGFFMRYVIFFLFFVFFISACNNQKKLTSYLRPVKEIQLDMKKSFFNEISVLFIIDNSGSMGVFNKILSENIKTFLRSLFVNYPHYNYNFAITQTLSRGSKELVAELNQKFGKKITRVDKPLFFEKYPDKCGSDTSPLFVNTGIGPYLHHSFKDLQTIEQADIICIISYNIQHLKNYGGDIEPLFDSLSYIIEQSKEQPYLKFREQFFGQNKLLVLFFLSDQWGQYDKMYYDEIQKISSPEERKEEVIRKAKKVADSFSAKQLKLLQSVMGESWKNIRTYAVVLDNRRSDRCGGERGGITPGRYPFHLYSLIEKTDGLRLSICDPQWGNQLTKVFDDLEKAFHSLSVELNEAPKWDSIEIYLNDKAIPRDSKKGWSLNLETLSIELGREFDSLPYLKDPGDCKKREAFDQVESDSCENKIKIKYKPLNIELLNRPD